MSWLSRLFRRRKQDAQLDSELRFHVEQQTADNIAAGMSPEEARRSALAQFGGLEYIKEETRDAHGIHFLGTLFKDVRFALRMLRKSPGYAAVAALTLALGIGANTAIFSVVDAVLLRSLPYPHADRLVVMNESLARARGMNVSLPDFLDWQAQNHSFEAMAAYAPNGFTLTGAGQPEVVSAGFVSWTFFSLLGAKPILGRTFTASEDRPAGPWTGGVVISYSLWQGKLHGDPKIIGKTIILDGEPGTVIGVLPSGFRYPGLRADVYNQIGPLARLPNYADRSNHPGILVLARLKPGVSLAAAQSDMDTIMARLGMEYPKSDRGERAEMTPIYTEFLGATQPVLLILFGAAGLVLLLACANVANLSLARSTTRHREMALRAAIGATRGRLLRLLFTESLLLSLLGGTGGVLFAFWTMKPLLALAPRSIPNISGVQLNTTVLLFTLLSTVLTGILFGLAPSLQAARIDLASSLKDSASGSSGPVRQRSRSVLLVAEIAVAMVLVTGSGLLIRSLRATLAVNPGFNPGNLLTLHVNVSGPQVNPSYDQNFYDGVLRRIRALPGVLSAAAVMQPPVEGLHWTSPYMVEGQPAPPPSERPWTAINMVTPDYFLTMQTPLLEGRFFTDADNAQSPLVVIINQTFAKRLWPNESAVGKRIYAQQAWRQVVGVVQDLKQFGLKTPAWPETFLPFEQMPLSFMTLVVRARVNPANLAHPIADVVQNASKSQIVQRVVPMTAYLDRTLESPRFSTYLLSLLGMLALLLAAIGSYGVVAYSVAQRTHEVGIRISLGASRIDILKLVIGRSMGLALTGIALGLGGAFALARFLRAMLFHVTPVDPLTFFCVAVLLALVALAACYIPARRAMKVDPMVALRHE